MSLTCAVMALQVCHSRTSLFIDGHTLQAVTAVCKDALNVEPLTSRWAVINFFDIFRQIHTSCLEWSWSRANWLVTVQNWTKHTVFGCTVTEHINFKPKSLWYSKVAYYKSIQVIRDIPKNIKCLHSAAQRNICSNTLLQNCWASTAYPATHKRIAATTLWKTWFTCEVYGTTQDSTHRTVKDLVIARNRCQCMMLRIQNAETTGVTLGLPSRNSTQTTQVEAHATVHSLSCADYLAQTSMTTHPDACWQPCTLPCTSKRQQTEQNWDGIRHPHTFELCATTALYGSTHTPPVPSSSKKKMPASIQHAAKGDTSEPPRDGMLAQTKPAWVTYVWRHQRLKSKRVWTESVSKVHCRKNV